MPRGRGPCRGPIHGSRVPEGEDAAVGGDEPVAGLVGRRADADDRALQGETASRPVEARGPEVEDAAVGPDHP